MLGYMSDRESGRVQLSGDKELTPFGLQARGGLAPRIREASSRGTQAASDEHVLTRCKGLASTTTGTVDVWAGGRGAARLGFMARRDLALHAEDEEQPGHKGGVCMWVGM